jgi:hypothetical protein
MTAPSTDPFGFSVLGRRRFLRLGLAAAAFAGGGYQVLRAVTGSAPHVPGLRALDDRRAKTLQAIVHTLLPVDGAVMNEQAVFGMLAHFDDFMAGMAPELAQQLRLAISYVELAPCVLEGRLRSFSELAPREREAHWRTHWEQTQNDTRRAVGSAFARLASLWCYDNEALWPAIHYPGPVFAPIGAK